MLLVTLREAARFLFGLVCTLLMAAAIAALSASAAWHGVGAFFSSMGSRLVDFGHLRFGTSIVSGLPAAQEILQRLPVTLALASGGIAIAMIVGVPLGLLFGTGPLARAASPLAQLVGATPVFCVGLALGWIARNLFHWPFSETSSETPLIFGTNAPSLMRMIHLLLLPILVVGAAGAASVQLSLRRAIAAVVDEPYWTGLRRLGLSAAEIDLVYVAPRVLAFFLTSLGELTLALLAASVVAEWVFNSPGIAVLFVKSVALSDWNMVALIVFAFAAIKLFADLLGSLSSQMLASPGAAQ